MSEKENAVSDSNDQVSNEVERQTKDHVAYDTYRKVLGQKKAVDQRLAEQAAKLAEYEAKEAAEKEAALIREKKFEEALALKEEKLLSTTQRLADLETDVRDAQKLQAVLSKLPGRIKQEAYYNLIDLSQVAYDPTTGAIDHDSVEQVASNFTKVYGADVLERPSQGKLPADAPMGSKTALSVEEWRKLPLKERKERMGEVYRKHTNG